MTIDEAIKHAEEVAEKNEKKAKSYPKPNKNVKGSGRKYNDCIECASEHRQLAEWLKDYKRLLEQEPKTDWIPVSEYGYPTPENEYKHFLTVDNKGEITIQEFLLSLDEEPQPYFTGMRNIVAYMSLPEPYK